MQQKFYTHYKRYKQIRRFEQRPFVRSRLILNIDKSRRKNKFPEKNLSKVVKFQNLVANLVKYGNLVNIGLRSSQIFYTFVSRVEIVTIFERKVVTTSARNTIIMRKFANFVRLYFPHITFPTKFSTNVLSRNFYNANCPFLSHFIRIYSFAIFDWNTVVGLSSCFLAKYKKKVDLVCKRLNHTGR